jgi:hypothetical protein
MSRDRASDDNVAGSGAIMYFSVAWIVRTTPPTLVSMSCSNCVTSFATKSPAA